MNKQPYYLLHFSRKHQLIANISKLFDDFTYTCRHGLAKGMRRKGGLGFLPRFLNSSIEATPEYKFLSQLSLKDAVVYDIGAFQGIITLFFSKEAKHVVAYEANPDTYARLQQNIALNHLTHVTLRNIAISDSAGYIELRFDELMPGAASADQEVASQITALSQKLKTVRVPAATLEQDIVRNDLPVPDFIKIDIEGAELAALRGMKRILIESKPRLYLEMHGATMGDKEINVAAIVSFLTEVGYDHILHIESEKLISSKNAALAREGHLYCSHE